MVRNAPSVTSLRNVAQQHAAHPVNTSEPQLVDLKKSSVLPLVGMDEHTKQLMMRIATDAASEEDHRQFQAKITSLSEQEHMNKLTPLQQTASIQHTLARGNDVPSSNTTRQPRNLLTPRGQEELQQVMAEQQRIPHLYQKYTDKYASRGPRPSAFEVPFHPPSLPALSTKDGMRATQTAFSALKRRTSTSTLAKPDPEQYIAPYLEFMTENPTIFHAVDAVKEGLKAHGFKEVDERDAWDLKRGGRYFVIRNGSALIAFVVGAKFEPGNGAAIIAGHIDALTAKLKPVSKVPNKAGYIQLGVAPYAGAPNNTWWDRDLGIGGRVLIKEDNKIVTKLVKLPWPIARIPTLAPHFGQAAVGPFNPETQMTPIIGLDDGSAAPESVDAFSKPSLLGGASTFLATQPPKLAKAIAKELGLSAAEASNIINWELELFDFQPATVGGIDKDFIFAGRIDDKLCSWAATQALIESALDNTEDSSQLKVVGLFDDEEIGSLLRQGARGNFLPGTIERVVGSFADHKPTSDLLGRTYANSFLLSADVIHAVNPNFLGAYLENHSPHLNTGLVVSADSNGHMTTDAVSTAILKQCADTVGAKLQVFQIRNDSRSGGTVGPMLSSATGIRAIDAGIPQLSMHSCRATTGSKDPGLGVITFKAFLDSFETIDKQFR